MMSDCKSEQLDSIQSSLLFGYDFNCDHCYRIEIAAEAIGYCEDCHEYLCHACYTVHTVPTPSEDHITILLNSDPTARLDHMTESNRSTSTDTLTDSCTETCPKHAGEILEYFCDTHKDIGCSQCMEENHNSCEEIDKIIDVSKNIDSNQTQELEDKICSIIRSSKSMFKKTQTNITKTETNYTKVLNDAHQFVEKVIKYVYTLEQEFIKDSAKIKNENIARLSEVLDEYSEASEQCQQMINEIKNLENNCKTCHLFIHMKKTEKKMQEIQDHLNDINSNNRSTLHKFKPNKNVNDILSETDLGRLQEKDKIGHYWDSQLEKFDAIYIRSGKGKQKCISKRQSHGRPYSWAHEVFRKDDSLGTIQETQSSSDA